MARNVQVHRTSAVYGGFVLSIHELPWSRWAGLRTVEAFMAGVGHPCCGTGLGRVVRVHDLAAQFLRRVEEWAAEATTDVAAFAVSDQEVERLAPGLAAATTDGDDVDDSRAFGHGRPPTAWGDDLYPDSGDVDVRVAAEWLARAADADMVDLVAHAVAGDQYDLFCCVWCFDQARWQEVGVGTMNEAVLWMAEGAGSPGEVQRAKDQGHLTSWALRVVHDKAARLRFDDELDEL